MFSIELPPLRERLDDLLLLAAHFPGELNEREGAAKAAERGRARGAVRLPVAGERARTPQCRAPQFHPRRWRYDRGREPAARLRAGRPRVRSRIDCGGHRERAAAMLGISAKTLYNRLEGYGRDDGAE